MVALQPAQFADHVERIHVEFGQQRAVYGLPTGKWFVPHPGWPDLAVRFHGRRAANPLGPAAGPHTQMAQNLVLAYLAGARIMELKTVQVHDGVRVARPCIDIGEVGYNIEWSQELALTEALAEYVAGAMLIHMIRHGRFLDGVDLAGPIGEVIYDLSIGYDLQGITSDRVRGFIEQMKDAGQVVDQLRLQIPSGYRRLRDLDYPTALTGSVTLSTFHGCPADEIEGIGEFILKDLDMDCIIKMNPPMLGKPRLEHLLYDVMGYREITVSPTAYQTALSFERALELCATLRRLAARLGRGFGVKFTNTLAVLNHRDVFDRAVLEMYLSGRPLHVLALTLADEFRRAVGPDLPISFSGGVDRYNFADMVACGFVPVTTCTDLLRSGGYARLPRYLAALIDQMKRVGAATIDDCILDLRGQRASAGGRVSAAAAANLAIIADQTRRNDRYRARKDRTVPRPTPGHLATFDCLACDKCIPVCPNAANFIYELAVGEMQFHDWIIRQDGTLEAGPVQTIAIRRKHQIANFADFCNECGHCSTFCPEYGRPFIEKPVVFGSLEAWRTHADRDGFALEVEVGRRRLYGRLKQRPYVLELNTATGQYVLEDGTIRAQFSDWSRPPEVSVARADGGASIAGHVRVHPKSPESHRRDAGATGVLGCIVVDMWVFHTMRLLLEGLLDPRRVHQANARYCLDQERGNEFPRS